MHATVTASGPGRFDKDAFLLCGYQSFLTTRTAEHSDPLQKLVNITVGIMSINGCMIDLSSLLQENYLHYIVNSCWNWVQAFQSSSEFILTLAVHNYMVNSELPVEDNHTQASIFMQY